MATSGTFRVTKITGTDKSRAVKRSLAAGASKVRITEGQRRSIVSDKRASKAT